MKKLPVRAVQKWAQGQTKVACALFFLVVSLFVNCTINTFKPSQSHSAAESQSCRFSVTILSQSTLSGGGGLFCPAVQIRSWQPCQCLLTTNKTCLSVTVDTYFISYILQHDLVLIEPSSGRLNICAYFTMLHSLTSKRSSLRTHYCENHNSHIPLACLTTVFEMRIFHGN